MIKIDLDILFSLLPLLRCEKIPLETYRFSMSDMTYEIYGTYNIYDSEAWNALM